MPFGSGDFDRSQVKAVPSGAHLPEHSRLRNGDVLITRANTRALVGAVCRVTGAPDNCYLSDKTLRLLPDESKVLPDYLVEALQMSSVRGQIELAATGTSASMKNISQLSIRNIRLRFPSLEEQTVRVANLAALTSVGSRVDAERRSLERVRVSLIGDLLSGTHRIPDSYDQLLGEAG